MRENGIAKWFYASKGYVFSGWIKGTDIIVNISAIEAEGFRTQ
jgi:cold shock CspA family protein